ncbi:MAG: filamentous hemagglutinin N-terminal domain-containing protein [Oscillatoria princeps RMCB-10]|jgi:filamentous hemagglutinin family protein|nr:filamentous hemagglutinin N-terminal domain-containing protein [Oscillatoria princeps RMCB-10]
MKQVAHRFWIAGSAVLWGLATGSPTPAQIVQIVPDATLPVPSAVTPNGNTLTVTGGVEAGTNLFHSFKEFSLPTGTTAHFNNSPAIQNIFTRVTGGSISNIDGAIRANGSANLFLLNPSGIIFGPNASLNIGGSFLASTANRIKFAGGADFSATNPQTPPLLTVSVPVGLQLGPNPGAIRVRGAGHSLSHPDPIFGQIVGAGSISAGLRVRNGKTLALVGGDIFLEVAGRVLAPSGLAASTLGEGKAGSLTVSTSRLVLRNGGRISSSALAAGDAGSIAISASESVELSGRVAGSRNPTQILSAAIILDESVQELYQLPPVPSGASGNVRVNTPRLSVTSSAQVTVRNDGAGAAGYVRINAGAIFLDSSGLITAATTSGEGGNIILLSQNLQMRHNSQISATAGGTGKGGNLTINTDTIAALEDSNIAANSVQAQGGNIRIRTQGIFRSLDSDITSTGGTPQLNGTVEINTPNVDQLAGLVTLPADVVDLAALIGSDPCAASRRNRFVVTGRGGLPPRPDEMLAGERVLMDWGTLEGLEGGTGHRQPSNQSPMPDGQFPAPNSLVEAQGWVIGSNGEVILTAVAPAGTPHSPWTEPAGCSVLRK